MLKHLLALALSVPTVMSSVASATQPKQYQVTAHVIVDGKPFSSPAIVTMANQKAEISQWTDGNPERMALSVLVSELPGTQVPGSVSVQLDFKLVHGERNESLSAHIATQPGQQAMIPISKDGSVQLLVSVDPIRN